MKKITRLLTFSVFALASAVSAAPTLNSALNAASYALPGVPNSGLAQGSMFVAFGADLGPAQLQQANTFPLPTELAGTSVTVTSGATTINCIMIYTVAGQVAAILPSNTPAGNVQMQVKYNGQTSNSIQVSVVKAGFGVFARNQAGSGPGIYQNPQTYTVNSFSNSAMPGQILDIWGTGLGAISGSDAGAPPVANLSTSVTVKVGGKQANVLYKGRSGCCAAIDQIRIEVPSGVFGCGVPVVVIANGIPSNYTQMAISQNGGTCTDAYGLTSQDLDTILGTGPNAGRVGYLSLMRTTSSVSIPGAGDFTQSTDSASGDFYQYTPTSYLATTSQFKVTTTGSCYVSLYRYDQSTTSPPMVVEPIGLDAGASIPLNGPGGSPTLAKEEKGSYFVTGSASSMPLPGQGSPFLSAGKYTFTGPGGADVGPFTASIDFPTPLNWTNQAAITEVNRSQGVTVTWTGGGGGSQSVVISGFSVDTTNQVAGSFYCTADPAAGTFTVPAEVTGSLPATSLAGGPLDNLQVGNYCQPQRFQANGIAVGLMTCSVSNSKSVTYK